MFQAYFKRLRFLLQHSLGKIFLILWSVRIAVLTVMFFLEQGGDVSAPFGEFFWTCIWYTGETILLFTFTLFLFSYRRIRLVLLIVLNIVIGFLILWQILDPIVLTLAGDHITPDLLQHFAGPKLFRSNYLWDPIKANLHFILLGFAVIFSLFFWLGRLSRRSRKYSRIRLNYKQLSLLFIVGVFLLGIPKVFGIYYFSYPPELIYLNNLLHWDRVNASTDDIKKLRKFIGLPRGARWVSDKFPLVYKPLSAQKNSDPPDIIIFTIESLRARDLHLFTGKKNGIRLPALERLAGKSVVFPWFVSNGFPSSEGFIATTCSIWPHKSKRIVQSLRGTVLDSLPERLASMGYNTLRVEDDPDLDGEGFWVRKYFQKSITFRDRGIYSSEKNMVLRTIQYIAASDIGNKKRPFYIHIKTAHPHVPYKIPDDRRKCDFSVGKMQDNYPVCLRYIDRQFSRLVTYLKKRRRWNNTVIVVLGDHSNYLSVSSPTSLPIDDLVWTGAFIYGPKRYIGNPKVIRKHASQVDVMPTLLNMVGDVRPTASLGMDLFGGGRRDYRSSIIVRPGGVRVDGNSQTVIIDRRHPSVFIRRPLFGDVTFSRVKRGVVPDSRLNPRHVVSLVDTLTWILEENKVWNPQFLQ